MVTHNNYAESDDGMESQSDIVTVSDIHTITSGIAFGQGRNHEPQDPEADVRTLDSSLFTVENHSNTNTTEVFDRHNIAKIGAQQDAVSEPEATAGSSRQPSVPYFREFRMEPPETPPQTNNASSLWERAKTKLSPKSDDNDDDRPLAVPTDPTDEDEEEGAPFQNAEKNNRPPGMIVVGSSRKNKNDVSNLQSKGASAASSGPPPVSVWKQKLCGLRADRLIVLLLAILLVAVAVIVAAIIISNKEPSGSSSSRVNTNNEDNLNEFSRTRTPTATTVAPPTASPVSVSPNECAQDDANATFNDDNGEERSCEWLAQQNTEDIEKICVPDGEAFKLCRKTCGNCHTTEDTPEPVGPEPTQAPVNPPTVVPTSGPTILTDAPTGVPATNAPTLMPWNVEECGGDAETGTFYVGQQQGMKDCAWLSQARQRFRRRVCTPDSIAFQLCRETCRNCGPTLAPVVPTTAPPTDAPALAGTVEPISTDVPVDGTIGPTPSPVEETNEPTNILETLAPTVEEEDPTIPPTAGFTQENTPDSGLVLVDLLAGVASVSADELQNGDSAQALAYRWLEEALGDGRIVEGDTSEDQLIEIFSIGTFFFSTEGDSWVDDSGWMQDGDICSWQGISCDNGSITGINLRENGLGGELPPELGLMSSLKTLIVSDNTIQGSIPESIGNLRDLEELRMDSNDLSGTIPTSIQNLQSLRIWYFERNPDIEGTMPDEIADLGNLAELSLYYTSISGELTNDICDNPNLEVLILDCKQVLSDCWTRCFYRCGGDTGVEC